jgi:hypothetical protein
MSIDLPDSLADKAAGFPECSYGVNRATLILKNGRRFSRVLVAWGREIIEIDGKRVEEETDLEFSLNEIADAEPSP